MWLITPLSIDINLRLEDSGANLLASPRIRTKNKEKARILIGDKVPVIINTVTPISTGGSVVTGTVQYLDVGVKLEVEPTIHVEGEVSIKMFLDVSNIVKEIPGPQGSLAYQIGTRSAETVLRMRDGETQILGGLMQDIDRRTAAKVPGLGQLPVLGRLFSSHASDELKTELILSITPRIIRPARAADSQMRDVFSGTDTNVREHPLRLDPVGAVQGTSQTGGTVAPGTRAAPSPSDAPSSAPPASPPGTPGTASPSPPAATPESPASSRPPAPRPSSRTRLRSAPPSSPTPSPAPTTPAQEPETAPPEKPELPKEPPA